MTWHPRVVHLINALPAIGGAERLVLDLARHAPIKPVPVITWLSPDVSLLDFDTDGDLEVLPLRPVSAPSARRAFDCLRACDVVHVHLFPSQYLGSLIRKPKLFTEHNTWNRRRELNAFRIPDRLSYRAYDTIVAISPETGGALTSWLGNAPRDLRTIPNGIRLDRFSGVARVAASSDRPIVIGMAARFSEEKDQRTLLRALALLPGYRLELGGSGPLESELRALAASLAIGDRVDFKGVISDMPSFFGGLDIYVQSSRFDGFSLVALEAMASGLPVIASDIDGLRDTIGRREQLAAPADPAALARAIAPIGRDNAAYSAAAAHGVERSRSFDVASTAARYQALYVQLAARRRA
jgi:glycosyltransferase involved in cell wall biosynthesis